LVSGIRWLGFLPPVEDFGAEPEEEYSEEWLEWLAAKEATKKSIREWESQWTCPSCCWLVWLPHTILASVRGSVLRIRSPTAIRQQSSVLAEAPPEDVSMATRLRSVFLARPLPADPPPPPKEEKQQFKTWQTLVVHNCDVRLSWLPSWAFAPETAKHQRARAGLALGPAVPWGFLGIIVLWGFYVCFPLYASLEARCASPVGSLATVPEWLLAVYLPVLLFQMLIEWMVLRHTVVAHAMRTAPFSMLSVPLRFESWAVVAFLQSAVAHMDIATTGVVLAKAYRTGVCASGVSGRTIPEIWRKLVTTSPLGNVPGLSNFPLVVLVSWALLLLQPLRAVLMALPVAKLRRRVDYDVSGPYEVEPTYTTYLEGNQNHQGAIMSLAHACRMGSVLSQSKSYEKSLCSYQAYDAISYVRSMKREIFGFGLTLTTEVIPQLLLQARLVALAKAVAHGEGMDGLEFTLASVALSAVFALKTLGQTSGMVLVYFKTVRENALDKQHLAHAKSALRQTNLLLGIFVALGVLDVLAVVYAATALFMAVRCPDAVWNLHGCVDLSALDGV